VKKGISLRKEGKEKKKEKKQLLLKINSTALSGNSHRSLRTTGYEVKHKCEFRNSQIIMTYHTIRTTEFFSVIHPVAVCVQSTNDHGFMKEASKSVCRKGFYG